MLEIHHLKAAIDGKEVIKGLSLKIAAGEIHAIMGPNGAGKSSLSSVLAGHPSYEVLGGTVTFQSENVLELTPEERSRMGIFKSFQYPIEVQGVSTKDFLFQALNQHKKAKGQNLLTLSQFEELLKEKAEGLKLKEELLDRDLHFNYSGGEKKKSEMLQMALLEPKLAILDETDSGLDIDALKEVAQAINRMRSSDRAIILITHYQRLLDYVKPDVVHIMIDGAITRSGNLNLVTLLEEQGYGALA